jgi:hypothetical protein
MPQTVTSSTALLLEEVMLTKDGGVMKVLAIVKIVYDFSKTVCFDNLIKVIRSIFANVK